MTDRDDENEVLPEEVVVPIEDQIDLREAEKALAEANTKGTLPLEALREELGL